MYLDDKATREAPNGWEICNANKMASAKTRMY
jgi:hypothetical protein